MLENEKAFEIVELNDGRKVKVVELTGLDEMIADKVVGGEMTSPAAGMIQQRRVMVAFSVKEIDGQPVKRPTEINQIRAFMAKFTMRQSAKIQMAYSRLNDPEGESQAVESEA